MNYDKDQGPRVEFRQKSQRGPSKTRGEKQPGFPKRPRSQSPTSAVSLEALVRGEQNKEHSWVAGKRWCYQHDHPVLQVWPLHATN